MNSVVTMPRSDALWRFSPQDREALMAYGRKRAVLRDEVLCSVGEPCSAFFVVTRGLLVCLSDGHLGTCREFRAGDIVDEAAFFGGGGSSATVMARRDSEVLEISRAGYAAAMRSSPGLAEALLGLLAERLQESAARPAEEQGVGRRSIALVSDGSDNVPPAFFERLRGRLSRAGYVVVDHATITDRFGALALDDPLISEWLDRLEDEGRPVFYLGERSLTEWTRLCIRHVHEVVVVTSGPAPVGGLGPVEAQVVSLHPPSARRLVRVHDRRVAFVDGTAAWLARMPVSLHHHVSLEDDADLDALARFLTGRAVGFVAGGGGGYGPAHVGIYRAFVEQGTTFDVFMGTSVGAAMLAGFARLCDHEVLTAGTHDIFVRSRSFKRPTWPRYALLDHKAFDAALARAYGAETRVEDCWKPFFAIATNLSANRMEIIRSGLLWQAVRASSAIPCVLPPFFTEDGTMLVDGGVMDDAPLAPMRKIKSGPNLVVHFGRTGEQRFGVDYEDLPGRLRLLSSLVNPRAKLPRAPRLMSVLFRTMLAHQRYELPAGAHDLVLAPPAFPGASLMSFDRHMDVFNAAYAWALKEIDAGRGVNNTAMQALLGAPKGGEQGADIAVRAA